MVMWRIALVIFAGCLGAMGQTNVSSLTVTPATLNFTAIDPDTGGPAAQASTAVARISGAWFGAWYLYVQSETPTLTNCGSIPASALVVRCQTASINGWLSNASCNSSSIPVSTTQATMASGNVGIFSTMITVNFQVSFADSWRYRAALAPACTVSLRYTVNAP
jgi:hypothetical protein